MPVAQAGAMLAILALAVSSCTGKKSAEGPSAGPDELELLHGRLNHLEEEAARQIDRMRQLSEEKTISVAPPEDEEKHEEKGETVAQNEGRTEKPDAPAVEPDPQPRDPPRERPDGDPFTRMVQEALTNAGFSPGPVDGRAGRMTRQAIMAFQRENNLPETGTANEPTWNLLRRYLD